MPAAGPLLAVALAVVQGAVYLTVGRAVSQRSLEGEDRRANLSFSLWWYSLGALVLVGAGFNAAAAFGYSDLALHVTLLNAALLVLCLALWGLSYYLAYLFTGTSRWLAPMGVFYGAYYVFLVYLVAAADPVAVEMGRWQSEIEYRNEVAGGPFLRLLLLLLIVPPVVGAIAYLSLFFRADMPLQRYRIALVGGSILAWFSSSIVASVAGWSDNEGWRFVSGFIAMAASLVILAAFRPPRLVMRRLAREVAA